MGGSSLSQSGQVGASGQSIYDQALKRLLSRAHDGFLELIAPGFTWVADDSPELPAAPRQADLVWEAMDAGGRHGLLHIELQTKPDKDIGERVTEYGLRLWLRDHLPPRSIVVLLQPAKALPKSPLVISWGNVESLRYQFDVVRLWEIPDERVLETDVYFLWPLSVVMRDVSVESAIVVAERIAATDLPIAERGELEALLVALSQVRLGRGTLREALRRHPVIDDLIKESGLADEWRAQGMAQGMAEGEQRMARGMARAAIEGRFGALSDDLATAVQAADEATLLDLVGHISTETLEQVRARLGLA